MIPRLAISAVSLLLALTCAEWALRATDADPDYCRAVSRISYIVHAPTPSLIPGVATTESRWCDGVPVFERASYTIDDVGRRVTPDADGPVALVLGCSFAFGYGLDDDETLPSRLSDVTGWRAVNLGVPSWGPMDAAADLRTGARVQDVARVDLAVYSLIGDHVRRCPRGMPDRPLYGFDLARGFWYRPGRPGLQRPAMIEALVSMRDEVATRWPGARFVVLAWPRVGPSRDTVQAIRGAGVEVLAPPSSVARGPLHRYDGHPSADEHASVAGWLAEEVGT